MNGKKKFELLLDASAPAKTLTPLQVPPAVLGTNDLELECSTSFSRNSLRVYYGSTANNVPLIYYGRFQVSPVLPKLVVPTNSK